MKIGDGPFYHLGIVVPLLALLVIRNLVILKFHELPSLNTTPPKVTDLLKKLYLQWI